MTPLPTALVTLAILCAPQASAEPFHARTTIKINRGFWEISGQRTYKGADAEGLLLNVRMVNCTFEDRNPATCPKGFDPDKNTDAFIAKIADYAAHGVRAFTLNLQGGTPNYKGALNSAFEPNGSLRPDSLRRVARVIEACDAQGVAVILGCFYQEQDQVLKDEAAVKAAVVATANWIRERGYTNVVLEIANEFQHAGFDHPVIQTPTGMVSLIEHANTTAPGLLVSTSGMGGGRLNAVVQTPASFLLIHFNNVPVDEIQERAATARKISKAIVANEDDKTGEEGAKALQAASDALCSWGYMNKAKNQFYPFRFEGAADDPVVYAKMKALTTPK
jgi:hypothetical protein